MLEAWVWGQWEDHIYIFKAHIQNVLSTALKFHCLGPQNGFQVEFALFRNSSC